MDKTQKNEIKKSAKRKCEAPKESEGEELRNPVSGTFWGTTFGGEGRPSEARVLFLKREIRGNLGGKVKRKVRRIGNYM